MRGPFPVISARLVASLPHPGHVKAIHHAARSRRSAEVLSAVLGADPAAVSVADGDGKVPLQLAVESGCSAEVISAL